MSPDESGENTIKEYDRIPVRQLREDDLEAIVRIDQRITGRARRDYFALKLKEALKDTRVRVSLGAEMDGHLAGFLMGKLYYGEFGVPDPIAILDTIGVDPMRKGQGVGKALLSQFCTNLRGMGIEKVQTQAGWNEWQLLRFLDASGFKPAARVCLEVTI
ncbi:MAG: GNAT family N-acetyltransferase [Planctomycetes bacterium]|nr:GNAT family N-acetyltransferase [Planctomycetota bacterium]